MTRTRTRAECARLVEMITVERGCEQGQETLPGRQKGAVLGRTPRKRLSSPSIDSSAPYEPKTAKQQKAGSRKPKTARVPRTRAGGEWTEASFMGWIRSGLRRLSLRWPPRKQTELAARRRYTGPNARRTWEYLCAECGCWCAGKDIQVDHIEEIGTLKTFQDLPKFCERLFCEKEGLRVLCAECHQARRRKGEEG